MMSESTPVQLFAIVFNCLTCGQMLTIVNNYSDAICPNCRAQYMGRGDPQVMRYALGLPPTQWISNGYSGPENPSIATAKESHDEQ